jgi:1-acyl-sn-glycerol-3-phosphate acyltransferase
MSSLPSSIPPSFGELSIVQPTIIRKSRAAANSARLSGVSSSSGVKPLPKHARAKTKTGTVVPSFSPTPLDAAAQSVLKNEGLHGPDPVLMKKQSGFVNRMMDYYFRLEIGGWDKLPKEPALFIGAHSGGPLTMDAWTIAYAWWRHFQGSRVLHATAHDVLMKTPGLGSYFRRMGVISPTRENIQAAFAQGDDVILWPGGEKDAFRTWTKRDTAVLGDRVGFIRLAIRSGRPIVPVATVGGHDTLFVLSEGRGLAKLLNLKKYMRSEVAPITLSFPLGLAVHVTPLQHIPLPSKIRTEFLEPIYFDANPAMADDEAYVHTMYTKVQNHIQAGMDRLAKKRKFPIFG